MQQLMKLAIWAVVNRSAWKKIHSFTFATQLFFCPSQCRCISQLLQHTLPDSFRQHVVPGHGRTRPACTASLLWEVPAVPQELWPHRVILNAWIFLFVSISSVDISHPCSKIGTTRDLQVLVANRTIKVPDPVQPSCCCCSCDPDVDVCHLWKAWLLSA